MVIRCGCERLSYHYYWKYLKTFHSQKLACYHETESTFRQFVIRTFTEGNGGEKLPVILPK